MWVHDLVRLHHITITLGTDYMEDGFEGKKASSEAVELAQVRTSKV